MNILKKSRVQKWRTIWLIFMASTLILLDWFSYLTLLFPKYFFVFFNLLFKSNICTRKFQITQKHVKIQVLFNRTVICNILYWYAFIDTSFHCFLVIPLVIVTVFCTNTGPKKHIMSFQRTRLYQQVKKEKGKKKSQIGSIWSNKILLAFNYLASIFHTSQHISICRLYYTCRLQHI